MFGIFRNIAHHLAIVRDSLRAEKEAPKQRSRSRNELEFLPAVLEVTETPPATIGRGIIWTIIAFVVASITWAFLGELDIVAVAPGRLSLPVIPFLNSTRRKPPRMPNGWLPSCCSHGWISPGLKPCWHRTRQKPLSRRRKQQSFRLAGRWRCCGASGNVIRNR